MDPVITSNEKQLEAQLQTTFDNFANNFRLTLSTKGSERLMDLLKSVSIKVLLRKPPTKTATKLKNQLLQLLVDIKNAFQNEDHILAMLKKYAMENVEKGLAEIESVVSAEYQETVRKTFSKTEIYFEEVQKLLVSRRGAFAQKGAKPSDEKLFNILKALAPGKKVSDNPCSNKNGKFDSNDNSPPNILKRFHGKENLKFKEKQILDNAYKFYVKFFLNQRNLMQDLAYSIYDLELEENNLKGVFFPRRLGCLTELHVEIDSYKDAHLELKRNLELINKAEKLDCEDFMHAIEATVFWSQFYPELIQIKSSEQEEYRNTKREVLTYLKRQRVDLEIQFAFFIERVNAEIIEYTSTLWAKMDHDDPFKTELLKENNVTYKAQEKRGGFINYQLHKKMLNEKGELTAYRDLVLETPFVWQCVAKKALPTLVQYRDQLNILFRDNFLAFTLVDFSRRKSDEKYCYDTTLDILSCIEYSKNIIGMDEGQKYLSALRTIIDLLEYKELFDEALDSLQEDFSDLIEEEHKFVLKDQSDKEEKPKKVTKRAIDNAEKMARALILEEEQEERKKKKKRVASKEASAKLTLPISDEVNPPSAHTEKSVSDEYRRKGKQKAENVDIQNLPSEFCLPAEEDGNWIQVRSRNKKGNSLLHLASVLASDTAKRLVNKARSFGFFGKKPKQDERVVTPPVKVEKQAPLVKPPIVVETNVVNNSDDQVYNDPLPLSFSPEILARAREEYENSRFDSAREISFGSDTEEELMEATSPVSVESKSSSDSSTISLQHIAENTPQIRPAVYLYPTYIAPQPVVLMSLFDYQQMMYQLWLQEQTNLYNYWQEQQRQRLQALQYEEWDTAHGLYHLWLCCFTKMECIFQENLSDLSSQKKRMTFQTFTSMDAENNLAIAKGLEQCRQITDKLFVMRQKPLAENARVIAIFSDVAILGAYIWDARMAILRNNKVNGEKAIYSSLEYALTASFALPPPELQMGLYWEGIRSNLKPILDILIRQANLLLKNITVQARREGRINSCETSREHSKLLEAIQKLKDIRGLQLTEPQGKKSARFSASM